MTLSRLYEQIVKFGKRYDPRNTTAVQSYADTAILYGRGTARIHTIFAGIDIEVPELLLADRIRKEKGLDLVIAHHPEGKAFASLFEVMSLQVDILVKFGVSRSVAEELLRERKLEVERRLHSQNHMRSVDAARLLDLPFMCVHTPADNHAAHYVAAVLKKAKKVSDIIDILMTIPEYKNAQASGAGPKILLGAPQRPVGKIFVDMTGGTEGPKEVFDKLYKKGTRTIVGMHLSEEHFKKVKDADLNVVIAGHISSDSLGMNLLFDNIEKQEKLDIISGSGFRRIRR